MKQPVNLSNMVNLGDEPQTSAPKDTTSLKIANVVLEVPNKFFGIESKQVSVKMSPDAYAAIRHAADKTELTHKDILLEGFELWIKQNAAKLK